MEKTAMWRCISYYKWRFSNVMVYSFSFQGRYHSISTKVSYNKPRICPWSSHAAWLEPARWEIQVSRWPTNPNPPTQKSPALRASENHWFPSIRPAIFHIFLRGGRLTSHNNVTAGWKKYRSITNTQIWWIFQPVILVFLGGDVPLKLLQASNPPSISSKYKDTPHIYDINLQIYIDI